MGAAGSAEGVTRRQKALWRQVALPTEHGGWSLTAEPVVLGLLVAWSWSGVALGLAAMLGFIARTPLKVVLVDRRRHRWLGRTQVAARIVVGELLVVVALVVLAAVGSASVWFWVPLAGAAPLIATELWFDMRSRSRRLVPELAGTIGIGSVVASIALAGGETTALAIGLWVVVSARAVAAIPYARLMVFRAHGRTVERWQSDVAQVLAVVAVAVAWALGSIPLAPVVVIFAVALFNVVALRGAVKPAVFIGVQQTVFGILVVVVTAVAVNV